MWLEGWHDHQSLKVPNGVTLSANIRLLCYCSALHAAATAGIYTMCQFVKRNENKVEGEKKKTIKRCHCCVYLGNITLRNGHMLTDSGQSAETLCRSNTHIWSLILQEERGKRVQPYPVMPAVTNQRTTIPSCSQRSEQKCTIVSFPAGQIVPCVLGLLC